MLHLYTAICAYQVIYLLPLHWTSLLLYSYHALSDAVGILIAIGALTQGFTKTSPDPVDRRNIRIQDDHERTLDVTLWGQFAHVLDQDDDFNSQTNVVIALVGMTVKKFLGLFALSSSSATKIYLNVDIPATKMLKNRYADHPLIVNRLDEQLRPRREGADDINENRMTIEQLLRIDISQSKGVFFTCKAKILDIDLSDGWFYNSCPICNKGFRFIDNKYTCPDSTHTDQTPKPAYRILMNVKDDTGEIDFMMFGKTAEVLTQTDIVDLANKQALHQQVLPECAKALIDQEKIFKVNLAKQSFDSGVPTYVVSRTFPTDQDIPATILPEGSSTPTSPPSSMTIQVTPGIQTESLPMTPFSVPENLFATQSPSSRKGISIREPGEEPIQPEQTQQAGHAKRKLFSDDKQKDVAPSAEHAAANLFPDDLPLKKLKSRGKEKIKE